MKSSQPQRNSLPERDDELLSAYLDQKLSAVEQVAFTRRLEVEPLLRTALEDLRSTVTALRTLEPVRPPRSFTLDPATVRRRPLALTWVLQLGSGFAGLALVLFATVQLLTVGALPASAPVPLTARAAPTAPLAMVAPTREAAPMMGAAAQPLSAPTAPAVAASPVARQTEATAIAASAPAPTSPAAGGVSAAGGADTANGAAAAEVAATDGQADAALHAPEASPAGTQATPRPAPAFSPVLLLTSGLALLGLSLAWFLVRRRRW